MALRFCLVTTFYPPYHFGGDGVCVHRLAAALAERGHAVDVIHSEDAYHLAHPAPPEIDFPEHPGVRRLPLRSRMPLLASLGAQQLGTPAAYGGRLRELLSGDRYDVIHYHNVSLVGGPGVLRYGSALKLYTTHEYWLVCPTHVLFAFDREACTDKRCLRCTLAARRPPQAWRATGWLRRCAGEVDRFLAPSRFAAERHRADGLDLPFTVLPHFSPDPPEGPADPPDEAYRPYVVFVGRLEKLKGVQDLLTLFAGYEGVRLLVVGRGDHEPVLKRQAAGLSHVRFLGQVHPSALAGLYRHALAVVVPSLCYEVFNLIPVEAFAHGTPALVRALGAPPELIEQSGGGFTWSTLEELRGAIERLRTEPGLRDALGERGRRARQRLWTERVHMERYLGLVDELLAARRGRRAS